ncbi:hypothetical protein BJ508DRAFT_306325 [Ascobolus immersus RN42]|uniref:Uncharacterized protein n=1 Tax=Ascobolus immersus RN42 TaxID=1160509 RepID=A0A3N4IJA3_ASCIM|nr:hypothetical protein BJ508DRAFT_306325 [Ascobolus immersus RN42]
MSATPRDIMAFGSRVRLRRRHIGDNDNTPDEDADKSNMKLGDAEARAAEDRRKRPTLRHPAELYSDHGPSANVLASNQVEPSQLRPLGLLDAFQSPGSVPTETQTSVSGFVKGLFGESQKLRGQQKRRFFNSEASTFAPLASPAASPTPEQTKMQNNSTTEAPSEHPHEEAYLQNHSPELSYKVRKKGEVLNEFEGWDVSDSYSTPHREQSEEEEEAKSTDIEHALSDMSDGVPYNSRKTRSGGAKKHAGDGKELEDEMEEESKRVKDGGSHDDIEQPEEDSNIVHSEEEDDDSDGSGTRDSDKHPDDFMDHDKIDDDYTPADGSRRSTADHEPYENRVRQTTDTQAELAGQQGPNYWPISIHAGKHACLFRHILHKGAVPVFGMLFTSSCDRPYCTRRLINKLASESDPCLGIRPGDKNPHDTVYDLKLTIGSLGFSVIAVCLDGQIAAYVSPEDASYQQLLKFISHAPTHIVQIKVKWQLMERIGNIGFRYVGLGNWVAVCDEHFENTSLWMPSVPVKRPSTSLLRSLTRLSSTPNESQPEELVSSASTITKIMRQDGLE